MAAQHLHQDVVQPSSGLKELLKWWSQNIWVHICQVFWSVCVCGSMYEPN